MSEEIENVDKAEKNKTNNKEKMEKKRKGFRPLSEQEKHWRNIGVVFFIVFMFLFFGQIVVYMIIGNYNDWLYALAIQIIILMPAYLADLGMAVVGGGPPLDRGYVCKDGRRLFGDGKTIRGFFLGPLLFGIPISFIVHGILYANWSNLEPLIREWFSVEGKYVIFAQDPQHAVMFFRKIILGGTSTSFWANFPLLFGRITAASFGTAVGDLVGSWSKRRLNRKRGEPIWGVDQLDFTVFVFLFTLPFLPWDINLLVIIIFTFIFTPSLTLLANWIGYALGLKQVPW